MAKTFNQKPNFGYQSNVFFRLKYAKKIEKIMIIKKTNNKHFSMIIAYGMLFCHMKILYRINIIYRIFAYQKIIVFKISNQISDSNLIMIEKSPVILYLKILLKLQRIYSLGCSVLTSFLYTDGIKNFVKNQKFRQKSKNLLKIEKVSHE